MLARRRSRPRGAVALENAIVLPTLFFVILTIGISGMGVFRYQQMAFLAREGARYASVHGGLYAAETGSAAASSSDVYNNAIKPKAVALDLGQLTYAVSWSTSNYPYHVVTDANNNLVKVTNTVTVTVNYHWVPEAYFGGMTLTSTSVMPMSY
jgi:Flp pilus assembly protein TadG